MPSVLIIDDDESICETLGAMFKKHGYHVDVAHTGGEAIRKSHERFYNAAFIDIVLPDMNGVELLTQLRETIPKMVKIMITGYASLDNAVEALNKGADAYIMKAFKPEQLLVTLKKKLEEQEESLKMTQEKIVDLVKERIRALESESESG